MESIREIINCDPLKIDDDDVDDKRYQRIIGIDLLSDAKEATISSTSRLTPLKEEPTTSTKLGEGEEEEEPTKLDDEVDSLKKNLKRSTSKVTDLVEEGQELNSKADIETKLETVYENGRVVEHEDHFEVRYL